MMKNAAKAILIFTALILGGVECAYPMCTPSSTGGTCGAAIPIIVDGACASAQGIDDDATGDPAYSCVYTNNGATWFSFVAPTGGVVNITVTFTCGGPLGPIVVYSSTCATPAEVSCTYDGVSNPLTAQVTGLSNGVTYYIMLPASGDTEISSLCVAIPAYCTSNATSNADSQCNEVVFNTISNNSSASGCVTYTDFLSISTSVVPGNTYPLTVKGGTCGGCYTRWVSVFIDYNNDLDFTDAGEKVMSQDNATGCSEDETVNVTIPAGATIGTTRMRVVVNEGGTDANTLSCGTYSWGETEDYTINICATEPGTASPANTTICPVPGTAVLTLSGYTGGSSIQWEESTDNATWADETGGTGGTTATYTTESLSGTTRYYRAKVTNGCSSYTSSCTVNADAALCTPSNAVTTGFEAACDLFLTTALDGGSGSMSITDATAPANSGSRHGSIWGGNDGSFITPIMTFVPGRVYTVSLWAAVVTCTGKLQIMKSATATNTAMKAASGNDLLLSSGSNNVTSVDYVNFLATFTVDVSEQKYIGIQLVQGTGGGCGSAKIYVDDVSITSTCVQCSNSVQDGDETGVDCGGTMCYSASPVGGTAAGGTSIACGGGSFTLCLSGHTGNIQWQISTDGGTNWYDISAANNTSYSSTASTTSDYRAKLTNDGCGTTAYSNTQTVTITGISAKTWDGGGGDLLWLTATNWNPDGVPTSCDDVTIPASTNVTVADNAACHGLTISSGGGQITLNLSGGKFLDVYGNLANNGNITQGGTSKKSWGIALQGSNNSWATGTGATYTDVSIFVADGSNTFMINDATIAVLDATKTSSIGTLNLGSNTLMITREFKQSGSSIHVNTGTLWLQITENMTVSQTTLYPDFGTVFWDLSGLWGITGDWSDIGGSGFYNLKQKSIGAGDYIENDTEHRTRNNFEIVSGAGTIRFHATNARQMQVEGNWIDNDNDGTPFIAGNSTILMDGTDAQSIGGTSSTTFNNLTIDNSSSTGVTINTGVTVNAALTLTDGHLISPALDRLTLGSSATVSPTSSYKGGSTASFVSGHLTRNLSSTATEYEFPMGISSNGKWRPLSIQPKTAPSVWKAELKWDNGLTTYGTAINATDLITAMNGDYYFEIARDVGNADVKMFYDQAELNTWGYSEADMVIGHWNGADWDNWGLNTGGDWTRDVAANWIRVLNANTFSPGGPSGGPGATPIELLVFDANYIDGKVRLDWTTATEINNDFFTIERCHNFCDPNKPESWEIVTTVDGSGNTSNEQSYSAYDYEPYSGISYYRLKQTDFDGKYEYFNPVAVEINKEGGETIFEVYPNPTSQDNINLGLIGHKKNDEVLLVLKNTLGQVIYSKVIITNEFGNAVTAINPNHKLAQGVYLVIGSSENAIYSKKLIIK